MRLSARSYPHPVLGNRDDVPGAAFQAPIEMSTDRQAVYISLEVACSCNALNALIDSGQACYVLHVECSNTLFRQAYEFIDLKHRISIPADNLNDAVEVNIFAHARQPINGYHIPGAHPDYGDAVFNIQRGDILALGEGRVFDIESNFDALSRLGSIMQISQSSKNGDVPMEPYFEDNKIIIFLSKNDFADYKILKYHEHVRDALTTMIVLPVLAEALKILKDENRGADDELRWVRVLSRKVEDAELSIETSLPIMLAQKLLELPVKRAFAASRAFSEESS